MKPLRNSLIALVSVTLGFVCVWAVPMDRLAAPGGALEILALFRMIKVNIPIQQFPRILLFVILCFAVLEILVRMVFLLRGKRGQGTEKVLIRFASAVRRAGRSLLDWGGLTIRVLLAGAVILIVVLVVRRATPLDYSALVIVRESHGRGSGNLGSVYLQLQGNNYTKYLSSAVRILKELNKAKPAAIVLPVSWWANEDTSADQRYIDDAPGVIAFRVPFLPEVLSAVGKGKDSVTGLRPIPTSLHETSPFNRIVSPLIAWRPLSAARFMPDSSRIVIDVSLAAVLKSRGEGMGTRFERRGHGYTIGSVSIPTDDEGVAYCLNTYPLAGGPGIALEESQDGSFRYYSQVGETDTIPAVYREKFENAIIFVNLYDRGFPAPASGFRSWEIAAITAGILQNSIVRRADQLEILCMCLVILIAAALFRFLPWMPAAGVTLVAGFAFAALAVSLARSSGIFLQALYYPGTAILAALVLSVVRIAYHATSDR